jgi:UDP-glucose 4-epimerase
MRILVLGSEGFIGSNAVQYFRALSHQVTGADIVVKTAPDYLVISPEKADFAGIFKKGPFDLCINATGAANVQFSFADPVTDYRLNVLNVYQILDGMRKHMPNCKFINFSSAAIYGNPDRLPVHERAAINPLSPYGYHKWYSEQSCRQYHELYGLQTISLRVFSAYGEGLKKQLFWDLYSKTRDPGGEMELFGTGKESRDFIYITDILFAMKCIVEKADFNGAAVNVASGTETTIRRAAEIFLEAMHCKGKLQFKGEAKMGDPLNWRADIGVLRSYGYENTVSIEQGIHNYCEWLREGSWH